MELSLNLSLPKPSFLMQRKSSNIERKTKLSVSTFSSENNSFCSKLLSFFATGSCRFVGGIVTRAITSVACCPWPRDEAPCLSVSFLFTRGISGNVDNPLLAFDGILYVPSNLRSIAVYHNKRFFIVI